MGTVRGVVPSQRTGTEITPLGPAEKAEQGEAEQGKNPCLETKTPDKPAGLPGASRIRDAVLVLCAVLHPTEPTRAHRGTVKAGSTGCFASLRRCTSELGQTRSGSHSESNLAGSDPRLYAKIVGESPPVRPFAQKLRKNPVALVTLLAGSPNDAVTCTGTEQAGTRLIGRLPTSRAASPRFGGSGRCFPGRGPGGRRSPCRSCGRPSGPRARPLRDRCNRPLRRR